MAHFLLQAAYTPEALQAMLRNPQDRTAALQAPAEKLGGKIQNVFLAFGDYDLSPFSKCPIMSLLLRLPWQFLPAALARASRQLRF